MRFATPSTTPPPWPGRELAAAIDNPVVTPSGRAESNGNFHGAPIAYVLDFLVMAVADLASISERRTDRFLDPTIDLFAEAQAVEHHERLLSLQRGRIGPTLLLEAATHHRSLGWDDVGTLAPGQRADLVSLRLDTVRTAGADPGQLIMVATAADVDTVLSQGRMVVESGRHRHGDVGQLLSEAITQVWKDR